MYADEIPVGKAEDLRGKKFGRWTVLYRIKDARRGVWWKCLCDCGNVKNILADRLKDGSSKSCGCLRKEIISQRCTVDLTGQTFGKLTVLYRSNKKYQTDNHVIWHCKCECGKECDISGNNLRTYSALSCGCSRGENISKKKLNNLIGQKFGKLTVLYRNGSGSDKSAIWHCKCDCGNECVVNHRYLRFGETESCGCMHSRGNATILRWLNANHYNFQSEYSFQDLMSKYNNVPYRFDFAIFDDNNNLKCLIEYQGNIHFKTTPNGWNNEKALADCQRRDKIKFDYCQKNNIKLYYITYKEIIEDRLEEIMNEQFTARN